MDTVPSSGLRPNLKLGPRSGWWRNGTGKPATTKMMLDQKNSIVGGIQQPQASSRKQAAASKQPNKTLF